jgi:4-hydroxy-4-methyl-2-oxoglutarate aldolase
MSRETSNEIFDELSKVRSPIVYDAIERFNLRSRSEGFMDSSIRCILPSLGSMVGYACTAKMVAELPPTIGEHIVASKDLWKYVERSPRPNIMVVQDLDQPAGRGCAWGDLAASIFLNLGCNGAITNGGVRDIREVEKLGFHLFAPAPVVGHSYIRFVEINTPVKVGSIVVHPGDLIQADEHGVLTIPKEIPLEELLKVIKSFLASEKTVLDYCAKPGFDLDELVQHVAAHEKKMGGHWKVRAEECSE